MNDLYDESVDDGVLRVTPRKNLVAATVKTCGEALEKSLASATKGVIIDLQHVTEIDSLGISLIIALYNAARKRELSFRAERANSNLQRLFSFFKLQKYFVVEGA
jgi:anti-anti-sigma factor